MKTRFKEIIEDEEFTLGVYQEELSSLKKKWIKTPWTIRLIEKLEKLIIEKEKLIIKLKEIDHNGN